MSKVLTRFGGFTGLLGTGVEQLVCNPTEVESLLIKKTRDAERGPHLLLEYQTIREIRRILLELPSWMLEDAITLIPDP